MIGITADTGDAGDGIDEMLDALDDPEPPLEEFGQDVVADIVRSFVRTPGHQSAPKGGPPAKQGGHLSASVTHQVNGAEVRIGTPEEYGAIHHYGGTIEMNDKALTVPIDDKARGKRAKDFGDLVFIPVNKGKTIGLLAEETAGGGILPLYALCKEVEIPERPWLIVRPKNWEYLRTRLRKHIGEDM